MPGGSLKSGDQTQLGIFIFSIAERPNGKNKNTSLIGKNKYVERGLVSNPKGGTVTEELVVLGGTSNPDSFGPAFYLYKRKFNDGTYQNVVFDCGAEFDEEKNIRGGNFAYFSEKHEVIHAVVLSHGHLDHVGMVPKLKRYLAPDAKIFASPQTHDIAHDLYWDSLKYSPGTFSYFEVREVTSKKKRLASLRVGENEILPGLKFFAGPNGHVPGSAFFVLRLASGKNALFLNDFCLHDQPVVKGAKLLSEWLPEEWLPDMVLVTDLTYGTTKRKKWADELARFEAWVKMIHARGGKALIPAFRFGRGQNMALELARLGFRVIVDGGIRSTFRSFQEKRWSENDQNDFSFEGITFVGKEQNGEIPRDAVADLPGPVVVVTTAGMGDGGPFGFHANRMIGNPVNGIARVGFCAPGTTMDRIIRAKLSGNGTVKIAANSDLDDFGKPLNLVEHSVICDVGEFSFTAHADLEDETVYFADIIKARRGKKFELIVSTHGSRESKRKSKFRFAEFVEDRKNLVMGETNTVIQL